MNVFRRTGTGFLAFIVAVMVAIPVTVSGQINKKKLYRTIAFESTAYVGSILFLNNIWYRNNDQAPFHFRNDNHAYLQADKFGHVFGSYVESYGTYRFLLNAGVDKATALLVGGSMGIIMQAPIEIFDGIHDGWGFSPGDWMANITGSLLVVGNELIFKEQLIKYKWSYWESAYARQTNGFLGETTLNRVFEDYNGHTYWLSVPLARITGWSKIPPWLNISAGYSINGVIGKMENLTSYRGVEIPPFDRYRQFLLSLDVDWTRIPVHSPFLKTLFRYMAFVKFPFPAIEINTLGKFRGYWMYY